mgnify:CR=1 FL=1
MILRLACLSLLRRPARHALLLLILAAALARSFSSRWPRASTTD